MDDPVAMFELTYPTGSLLNDDIPEYGEISPCRGVCREWCVCHWCLCLRVSSKEDQSNLMVR